MRGTGLGQVRKKRLAKAAHACRTRKDARAKGISGDRVSATGLQSTLHGAFLPGPGRSTATSLLGRRSRRRHPISPRQELLQKRKSRRL